MPRLRPTHCLAALLAAGITSASRADEATPEVPQEAVVGDLPFLPWHEPNRVVLNLAPEGARAFQLMLDTGASDSVLTPRYARALGVSIRRARDRPYERDTLLGRPLQFWVDTESSESASRTGWEYGLLGGTFLADYVLEIDFHARRVRFLDPARFEVPKSVTDPNEAVLPVRIVGNRVIVEVQLEGKPVQLMLDTGAPITMLLSGKSARRAGFDRPALADMVAGGVLGTTESHLVEAEKLELGPFAFAPAPLELAPKGFYNQGSSSDSLLGYEVLQHFQMRIDYPHQRLWLRRLDADPLGWEGSPWQTVRRVGVLAQVTDAGLYVSAVLPDSPAAKLGVRAGDSIEFHGDTSREKALEATLATIERGERITVVRPAGEDEPPTQVELGGEKPITPEK
jgi:predicted aspartyl protease